MTKGKTNLIQKDPIKRTNPNNYRLIRPMMWQILSAKIREEIYNSLINCRLFTEERKDAGR